MVDLNAMLAELGHTEAKRGRKPGDVDPRTLARFEKLDALFDTLTPNAEGVRVYTVGDELGTLTAEDIGCQDAPTMLAPTIKAWAKARGYEVAPKAHADGVRFIVAGPVPEQAPVSKRSRKA